MPIFYIKQGSRAGQEIRLNAARIIIGRSPDNLLVLPDESVDLAHASLEDRGNYWILQALGASEGTWLNDELLDKPCRVFDGDVIRLGAIRVELQEVGSPGDGLPETVLTASFAQAGLPLPEEGRSAKRFYVFVGLGGLIALLILVIIGILISAWFFFSGDAQENKPPVLRLLTADQELIVSPGEKVVLTSEAQDQEDLGRVEFWVDDVLQDVSRPKLMNVIKMQTVHQWASDQPGEYILSVVAYDDGGRSSQMLKVRVIVREP